MRDDLELSRAAAGTLLVLLASLGLTWPSSLAAQEKSPAVRHRFAVVPGPTTGAAGWA